MDKLTETFLSWARDSKDFEEGVSVVKSNSQGKVWLIGGFVYKTIISRLYGGEMPKTELRFFVEKASENVGSYGWWVFKFLDRNGNYKFVSGEKEIYFTPLNALKTIKEMNLEPRIENYFLGIPLTVQAIAYDINSSRIIGDKAIEAIMKKTVSINNKVYAERAARKLHLSLEKYVELKAERLGFKVE